MMNTRPRILAVDDDQTILSLVVHLCASVGVDAVTASGPEEALKHLRERHQIDLVLMDLRMPGTHGLDLLTAIRETSPRSRVVVMTGYATIDGAVRAVKLGASDYLTKPFDLQRVRTLIRDVREESEKAAQAVEPEVSGATEFCGMVGRGSKMQDVFALLRRIAPHSRTTLITGETGTGKELAARALHMVGPRSQRRMVTVNCSAVVETLFESELFGHVRGAFTGATDNKAGLFEAADGGTLFLDEVGELPAGAQAKLLRVLEDGEVLRVGSLESRRVDVRVIAATNRDLSAEVEAGRFRSDLYYRLNVVQVHLPPLRDRREDIVSIANTMIAGAGRRLGRSLSGLTPRAEVMLTEASWEGNVRQLRNVLERACILADGDSVSETDLAGSMDRIEESAARDARPAATILPLPTRSTARLDDVEREHIVRTLAEVRGNKAVAARLLGVSRRAFYRQLERHGLHTRVPAVAESREGSAAAQVLGRAS